MHAEVAELADAQDLKSCDANTSYRFDSGLRHQISRGGAEPVIRVMVEAASDEICEKYVDSVVKVIESEGLCE